MKSGSARRAVLAASSRVWPGCRPPRAGLAGEPRRRHVPWLSRERRRRASPHYGRRAGARPRRRRGRSRRDLAPRCTDTRLLGVRRLGRCRGDRHSQRRVRRQRPPATRPRTRNYRWPSVFRHHTALVEFIPRAPSETRVVHIRPVYDDTRSPQSRRSWFSESDGQSRVLATLGTVNNRNQLLLTKLLEAVAGEDCQVLLALGDTPAAPDPVPRNVHVERYVPVSQVVSACAAVVSHAGRGTVRTALSQCVPLCSIPISADQPVTASLVERPRSTPGHHARGSGGQDERDRPGGRPA
jgi:UDP:flavonoid glycosyltransferase YjiC (YdhE family)